VPTSQPALPGSVGEGCCFATAMLRSRQKVALSRMLGEREKERGRERGSIRTSDGSFQRLGSGTLGNGARPAKRPRRSRANGAGMHTCSDAPGGQGSHVFDKGESVGLFFLGDQLLHTKSQTYQNDRSPPLPCKVRLEGLEGNPPSRPPSYCDLGSLFLQGQSITYFSGRSALADWGRLRLDPRCWYKPEPLQLVFLHSLWKYELCDSFLPQFCRTRGPAQAPWLHETNSSFAHTPPCHALFFSLPFPSQRFP